MRTCGQCGFRSSSDTQHCRFCGRSFDTSTSSLSLQSQQRSTRPNFSDQDTSSSTIINGPQELQRSTRPKFKSKGALFLASVAGLQPHHQQKATRQRTTRSNSKHQIVPSTSLLQKPSSLPQHLPSPSVLQKKPKTGILRVSLTHAVIAITSVAVLLTSILMGPAILHAMKGLTQRPNPSISQGSSTSVSPTPSPEINDFNISTTIGDETLTLKVSQGKVCQSRDDGQPHDRNYMYLGMHKPNLTFTTVFQCNGTYQNGHLSYTEIVTSDDMASMLDPSIHCSPASNQYDYVQLDGTVNDQSVTGTSYSWSFPIWNCGVEAAGLQTGVDFYLQNHGVQVNLENGGQGSGNSWEGKISTEL